MSNVNRYVGGKATVLPIGVLSAVTVHVGDLMFLNKDDNLMNDGNSTADNYGYPFEYFRISGGSLELNKAGVKSYFLGVALDDKDGVSIGNDQTLTVMASGIFDYDLKPSRSVSLNDMFCAAGTTTASNLYNQKIMKTDESDKALGFFTQRKLHAQNAEVFIRTIFGNEI